MFLKRLAPKRLTGNEPFSLDEGTLSHKVIGFWQWSTSDLISNATRGCLCPRSRYSGIWIILKWAFPSVLLSRLSGVRGVDHARRDADRKGAWPPDDEMWSLQENNRGHPGSHNREARRQDGATELRFIMRSTVKPGGKNWCVFSMYVFLYLTSSFFLRSSH